VQPIFITSAMYMKNIVKHVLFYLVVPDIPAELATIVVSTEVGSWLINEPLPVTLIVLMHIISAVGP
jgi:hypothetical protein